MISKLEEFQEKIKDEFGLQLIGAESVDLVIKLKAYSFGPHKGLTRVLGLDCYGEAVWMKFSPKEIISLFEREGCKVEKVRSNKIRVSITSNKFHALMWKVIIKRYIREGNVEGLVNLYDSAYYKQLVEKAIVELEEEQLP